MARHNVNSDRWLALGLLFIKLSVLYLLLVHPWFTRPMLSVQQQIQVLRDRELRIKAQLQQGPNLAEQLRRIQVLFAGLVRDSCPSLRLSLHRLAW